MKLNTIKETFQFIVDNIEEAAFHRIEDKIIRREIDYFYLCNYIKKLHEDAALSDDLFTDVYHYFLDNRPTKDLHTEFYNNKYYTKKSSIAWWYNNTERAVSASDINVIEEKIKFLKYLITLCDQ